MRKKSPNTIDYKKMRYTTELYIHIQNLYYICGAYAYSVSPTY